jgi:hypothetical protein
MTGQSESHVAGQSRPVSATNTAMSSANSTMMSMMSTVKGHKEPTVDATYQETFFRSVSNALQPLKPQILPNDLLEYEYSQYLDEELMRSLLEEDEETTKNVTQALSLYFFEFAFLIVF